MNKLIGLIVEALLVVAVGLGLGWAGNGLSPRGLRVDRDYFPRAPESVSIDASVPDLQPDEASDLAASSVADGSAEPAAPAADESVDPGQRIAIDRLRARGLVPIGFDEARALYEDPLYAAGAYVFLDARNEEEHAYGHIPGALVFDHYHMERYLADVMALAPGTMRMVVYCSGGDCEDSEFAAATLGGMLPDPSILRVYVGGMSEWEQRGMPVETGP